MFTARQSSEGMKKELHLFKVEKTFPYNPKLKGFADQVNNYLMIKDKTKNSKPNGVQFTLGTFRTANKKHTAESINNIKPNVSTISFSFFIYLKFI